MYSPTTSKVSFVVDPQRDGISNALWFEVTATIAVSSNKFRFNTAEGLVRADIKFGRIEFNVTVPLSASQTPTNLNNDLEFGLKNLSLGTLGKISCLLSKSGDSFTFNTYDIHGTAVQSTTITWDTDWNGAATRFVIEWFNDRVRLLAYKNAATAPVILAEHKSKVGQYPLNPFVKATGNDNLDVSYIVVDNAAQNSIMLI